MLPRTICGVGPRRASFLRGFLRRAPHNRLLILGAPNQLRRCPCSTNSLRGRRLSCDTDPHGSQQSASDSFDTCRASTTLRPPFGAPPTTYSPLFFRRTSFAGGE